MTDGSALLQPGDTVRAWGVLLRDEDGEWFEPPGAVPLVYPTPVRPHSRRSVPIVGADFGSLTATRTEGPRIAGTATITGRWTGEAVEVVEQSDERGPRPLYPSYTTPPGPPPPGGWPRGGFRDLRCSYGGLRRSGVIVASTRFRPSRRQAVLVVAAVDVAMARAQLHPQLGDRLCVVPSRCTRAEYDRVRRQLSARWRDWSLFLTYGDPDDAGQPSFRVHLSRLLPEVLDWVATTPPGFVTLLPWLAPWAGEAGGEVAAAGPA